MLKYTLTILVLIICSYAASAQSNASATISATISNPISISQSKNMNYSAIIVSPLQGGSIVMDPNGKEETSGGVKILNTDGVPASFVISGQGGYTYSITLPSTPVALDDESANLLNITDFTSYPALSGPTLQSGTQKINVGATLNLEKAESTGTVDAEIPFDISVNYN